MKRSVRLHLPQRQDLEECVAAAGLFVPVSVPTVTGSLSQVTAICEEVLFTHN